jgi:hypothetical protein
VIARRTASPRHPPNAAQGVELGLGYVEVAVEILLQRIEPSAQITGQFLLHPVAAENKGPSDIGLPFAKHRSEIDKNAIILGNFAHRRMFIGNAQRVYAGANDAPVPVSRDAERPLSEVVNVVFDHPLGATGRNQASLLDRCEQFLGFLLGRQQRLKLVAFPQGSLLPTGSAQGLTRR